MKDKWWIAFWTIFILVFGGFLGYVGGLRQGIKARNQRFLAPDVKEVAGVVWYSDNDKPWQLQEFRNIIDGFGSAYLTETKKLED